MGKINIGRVILGGLLAGLVLNIGEFIMNGTILKDDWLAVMESFGLPPMEGAGAIAGYVILSFVMGIVLVFFYAAMRPRFGAGVKTAVLSGLAVWLVNWVLGFGSTIIMGLFPTSFVLTIVVLELFLVPIATVVGAWLYKED